MQDPTHAPSLVLTLLALLAGAGLATPGGAQAPALAVAQGHGFARSGSDWVGVGPGYRLVLGPEGVEFTPVLGPDAPVTRSLRLALQSIGRGAEELDLRPPGAPRVSLTRAVYGRGAGVEERFDTRADGVEISYVFDRPIAGTGDLVVRLRTITTMTRETPADPADGLRLDAPGPGGVRIGAVTGIDARGARAAGAARWDGEILELSLPAAFVDRATWPLVLDPLIGTDFALTGASADSAEPDVSYDTTHDVYLAVWQRDYSMTDIAIHAQRLDAAGNLVGAPVVVIDSSAEVAARPTVANVHLTDRFLVAWQQGPSAFGPWTIRGACVDAATGAVSSDVAISSPGGISTDPDAGGESTLLHDAAMVVWRQLGSGKNVYAAAVTCPASGPPVAGPATFLLGPDLAEPSISKHGGAAGRYLVGATHPGFSIESVLIDRSANVLATLPLFPAALGDWVAHVDVDGDGDTFVAAWDRSEGGEFSDRDVECRRVGWDTQTSALVYLTPITAVASTPAVDESRPAVGIFGPKIGVAWAEEQTLGINPFSTDINVLMLGSQCEPCGFVGVVGALTSPEYDTDPVFAPRAAGGRADDQGFLAFAAAVSTPPFRGEVHGQLVEAVGAGGAIVEIAPACGAGGVAGSSGPVALANTYDYTLRGADPAATTAIINLGIPGAARLPCGPCSIMAPVVQLALPAVVGDAAITVTLPCNLALVGGNVEMQWWTVPAAGGCTIGNIPLAFSNIVDITVGL